MSQQQLNSNKINICQICARAFSSKKAYSDHFRECSAKREMMYAQSNNSGEEEDDDEHDEEEEEMPDFMSVVSGATMSTRSGQNSVEKLLSDKKKLKDELKQLLARYDKKKREADDTKKLLDEAMVARKRYEDEMRQIADEIRVKKDNAKNKELYLKARQDQLEASVREQDEKIKRLEGECASKTKEFEIVLGQKTDHISFLEGVVVADRDKRLREFEMAVAERDRRLGDGENRIRDLEARLDAVQHEHRNVLIGVDREKAQKAAQLDVLLENVRQHALKSKDGEIQQILSEHKATVHTLRCDLDHVRSKLTKTIDQSDKIVLDVRTECELQVQKIRADFGRMRAEYEGKLAEQMRRHSNAEQAIEQKAKDDIARLVSDHETKLRQEADTYKKIIQTLQSEYNKKNAEFNENMIQLRSDIEFYKKSLAESVAKKEAEGKADTSVRVMELKMEYEAQINLCEQEKKALAFEQQLQIQTAQAERQQLLRDVEDARAQVVALSAAYADACKLSDKKVLEIHQLNEKIKHDSDIEKQRLRDEMSHLRRDTDAKLLHARQTSDDLVATLTRERRDHEAVVRAAAEAKSMYEQKLNSARSQTENAVDRASNKLEEARLALEKEYREQLSAAAAEAQDLRVKLAVDTGELRKQVDRLNLELQTKEAMLGDAHATKMREVNVRFAEEITALTKKHSAETQHLRTDLKNARAELEHALASTEQLVTTRVNEERARALQSFADDIERASSALSSAQQELFAVKKSSVDTISALRSELAEEKRRDMLQLEKTLCTQIDALSFTLSRERADHAAQLDSIRANSEAEQRKQVQDIAAKHTAQLEHAKFEFARQLEQLKNENQQLSTRANNLIQEMDEVKTQRDADLTNACREFERRSCEQQEEFALKLKDATDKLRKQIQDVTAKSTFDTRHLLQEIELLNQSKKIEINELRAALTVAEQEIERSKQLVADLKTAHAESITRLTAEKERFAFDAKQKTLAEEKLKNKDEQLTSLYDKVSRLSEENMRLKTQHHLEIESAEKEHGRALCEKENEYRLREDELLRKHKEHLDIQKLGFEETISQLLKKNTLEHIKLDHDKHIASIMENFAIEKRTLADSIAASFSSQLTDLKDKLSLLEIARKDAVQRFEECNVDKNIYLNELHILRTKLFEIDSLRKVADDQKTLIEKLTDKCKKLEESNEQLITQKSDIQQRLDHTSTVNDIFKKQIAFTGKKERDEYKKTVDKLVVENLKLKQELTTRK